MTGLRYHRIDRDSPLNPAVKIPLRELVQTRLRIQIAKFRLWLRKRGVPLQPTLDDIDAVFDSVNMPLREWIWRKGDSVESQVADVVKWLDDAVLRAPVVRGLDCQMCSIGLYTLQRQQVNYQGVVLDKYNWRKQGRTEFVEWLTRLLDSTAETELAITVQAVSLGNMMRRYAEMLKS